MWQMWLNVMEAELGETQKELIEHRRRHNPVTLTIRVRVAAAGGTVVKGECR